MNLREEISTYRDIKKYKSIIDKRNEEISEMQMIVDSLTDSLIKEIKKIVLPYSSKMLQNACLQQNKTESNMYDFVTEDLKERLFDKDERKLVKFTKITCYGLESWAYGFHFEYKGFSLELKIPNLKSVNSKNMWEMHYGEYQLYHEIESNYWRRITHSYDLDDIAEYINAYVNGNW